jgi:hypothetical protein
MEISFGGYRTLTFDISDFSWEVNGSVPIKAIHMSSMICHCPEIK